jgi:hypothetical protein
MFLLLGLVLVVVAFSLTAHSADTPQPSTPSVDSPAIVIGFVGGFVHRNDPRHSEVQLAKKLGAEYGSRAHVAIFENHRREDAHAAILNWLDSDHDGLSAHEKHGARIVIYGHSWGAAAVLGLARELEKDRIPVLLTIQVDSIAKPGLDDRLIPANVARAVNFYQTGGPLHGNRQIVAADPERTQILGDFRFDYKAEPAPCSAYPWFARHFLKGHTSIECDPNVWSRVEALIGEYLLPAETQASTQKASLRNGGGVE